MSTITFKGGAKSGFTTESENIIQIVIIDVQDLQKHYGGLLADEIRIGGAHVSVYRKKFNDCNDIIGLLEGLKEPSGPLTPDAIESMIKLHHAELAIEAGELSTAEIDAHPITKKIVELEAMIAPERVDKIYAGFLMAA